MTDPPTTGKDYNMTTQETPYRKQEITLHQVAADPDFSKGWYVKVVDHDGDMSKAGPFVVPIKMYMQQFSEYDPVMFIERVAFFNRAETVVIITQPWRDDRDAITLLHWTRALEYLDCNDSRVL